MLDAEKARAAIFTTPTCKEQNLHIITNEPIKSLEQVVNQQYQFIAQMDEDYLVIGGHIDEVIQKKIENGEYIDFGRLLPKDIIITEEVGRMELVVKNGKTFWVPVTESVVINNFSKWEQAFRIYSNLYTWAHPHRSSELIQYNHIIHSIAMQFTWENVYSYDKEFRIHLTKHPE